MADNEIRERMVGLLEAHPEGMTILGIAQALELNRNTVTKYVYELSGAGVIVQRKVGSAKLCFVPKPSAAKAAIKNMKNPKIGRFLPIMALLPLFFLALSALALPAHAINTQSHPLSELTPIDTDFDMMEYNILNLTWANATSMNASNQICVGGICRTSWPTSDTNNMTGSGTAGYLAKWVNGTAVNASGIFELAGNVGIGTAVPNSTLHVVGTVNISAPSSNIQLRLQRTVTSSGISGDIGGDSGNLYFYPGGYDVENGNVIFKTSGKVGIGTIAPVKTLDVVGDINATAKLFLPLSGSSGGIVMGGDANLYRVGANQLKTDDSLIAAGAWLNGTSINASNQICVGNVCRTTWPSGTIGGSGTENYIPKFTPDGTSLGDSMMYETGSSLTGLNVSSNLTVGGVIYPGTKAGGSQTTNMLYTSGTTLYIGNPACCSNIDFLNNNIQGFNSVKINDAGVNEGFTWTGTAAGWIMDVSPLSRTNADGNLNLYGTANNIIAWRPLYAYGAAPQLLINSTGTTAQFLLQTDATTRGNITADTSGNVYITPGNYLIVPSGSVGIGTTAPVKTFDVVGDMNATAAVLAGTWVNATNLNASSKVYGSSLCIGSDCRTSWLSAGGNTSAEIISAVNGTGTGFFNLTSWFTYYVNNATERTLFTNTYNASYMTNTYNATYNAMMGHNTSAEINAALNSTFTGQLGKNTTAEIRAAQTINTSAEVLAIAVSRTDWTTHDSYPDACAAGQVASAVGDTLTCVGLDTGNNITGAGTAGYVPLWYNSTALNTSLIFQNNSNVSIGTAAGNATFHIYKSAPASNYPLFRISTSDSADRFMVDEDGDVSLSGTLTATGDVYAAGSDFYDASGDVRLSGEDNVILTMDYDNTDADIRALYITKNAMSSAPGVGNLLMVINETGKIGMGIGITNATQKTLDVVGDINATGSVLAINSGSWMNATSMNASNQICLGNVCRTDWVTTGNTSAEIIAAINNTGLGAGNITLGTLTNARLDSKVHLINQTSLLTAQNLTTGTVNATHLVSNLGLRWENLTNYNLNSSWFGTLGGRNITNATLTNQSLTSDFTLRWGNVTNRDLNIVWNGAGLGAANITTGTLINARLDSKIHFINNTAQLLTAGNLTTGTINQSHLISSFMINLGNVSGTLNNITGAGSQGNISLWYNGTALNSSAIFQKAGNVGIGTTSPDALLSLGTSLGNTKLALYDDGTGTKVGVGIQSNQFRFHVDDSGTEYVFFDAPGGNPIFTIKGTGKVGIGTGSNNTQKTLDVVGDINATGSVFAINSGSWMNATSINASNQICVGDVCRTNWPTGGNASSNGTTNYVAKFSDATMLMNSQIYDNGNVGIGTASPTHGLEVVNNVSLNSTLYVNGSMVGIGTAGPYRAKLEVRDVPWGIYGLSLATDTGGRGIELVSSDFVYTSAGSTLQLGLVGGTANNASYIQAYTAGKTAYGNLSLQQSGGNVGIGTNEPADMLHIEGTSPELRFNDTDAPSAVWHIGVSNPGYFRITETNVANRLTIQNVTGFIGINNTAPEALLHIKGTSATPELLVEETTASAAAQIDMKNTARTWQLFSDSSPDYFGIYDSTAGAIRLSVDNQGKVGINTTTPYSKLNVREPEESTTQTDLTQDVNRSGILITTELTHNAYTPGIFWNTENNNADKPKAGIYMKEDTSAGTYMYFGTTNNFATGITNDAMVIDYLGNVGIGTTDPNTSLHVNGVGKFEDYVNMTTHKIVSLATPVDASDAATKDYVDASVTTPAEIWSYSSRNLTNPASALNLSNMQVSGYPSMIGPSSSNVLAVSAAEVTNTATNNRSLKKEVLISMQGMYTVKWEQKSSSATYAGYAQIYKNGAPYGTQRNIAGTSYSWVPNENLTFLPGDVLQLYLWGSSSTGHYPTCRNLQIMGVETNYVWTDLNVSTVKTSTDVLWAGYTAVVSGNRGGSVGLSSVCDDNHTGSHACTWEEILELGYAFPWSENAWLVDGSYTTYSFGTSTWYQVSKDGYTYGDENGQYAMCRGWTSSDAANNGPYLIASTNVIGISASCATTYAIPCCY